MKRSLSMLLAGVMLVGTLAGCGGNSTQSGSETSGTEENTASGTAFKIGGTAPLTGGAAIYGNAVKNGAELAAEEINAEGGDIQFEVVFEDDENNTEKAVSAYNALKDEGIQLSLSAVTSKPGEAIAPLLEEDHIFALTPSASSPANIEGNDVVFQMCFSDPNQGKASADYISDNGLAEKVAVIYNSSDVYSTGIYQKFAEEAKAKGLEIVAAEAFTADSKNNFEVQLKKAQDAGADLVFLPIYYQEASLILTQADQIGYAPKFFGCDGLDGILAVENFDTSLAEGVMLLTPFTADAEDEMTQTFVKDYEDAFDITPIQFAADAYDCMYAIKAAAEDAELTPDMSVSDICEAMKTSMTKITIDGLTGSGITWTSDGEPSKEAKAVIIEDGSYKAM